MLNHEYLCMNKYGKYILVNYFVISFDVSRNIKMHNYSEKRI